MVARSPPTQRAKIAVVAPPISQTLLRETLKKVDKCMARLEELQYTVKDVGLNPRSGRSALRTSLRCKPESVRMKGAASRRSPPGKLPINKEDWQRMSLPAMLLRETMGEILQASQMARDVVEAVSSKSIATDDPKTPRTERIKVKTNAENSGINARRLQEKQVVLQKRRSECNTPSLQQAKSRITFKVVSPVQIRECEKENCRYIANRVSPRNRPWARKSVLFPNPLFQSSPTSHHQKFGKTMLPVIARKCQTPHKFLIKSPRPAAASSKIQMKIKSSPTRPMSVGRKSSPKDAGAKFRRSFSPTALAKRLVSPLKSRNAVQRNEGAKVMAGLRRHSIIGFSPRTNKASYKFC